VQFGISESTREAVSAWSVRWPKAGADLLTTLTVKEPFGEGQRLNKKINRESFVMPA
jgi:hypothetical protein